MLICDRQIKYVLLNLRRVAGSTQPTRETPIRFAYGSLKSDPAHHSATAEFGHDRGVISGFAGEYRS